MATGNDLDNAWIHFDHVELPRSAKLNRFADIDEDGQYALRVPGIRPFDMIGQRLYADEKSWCSGGIKIQSTRNLELRY